MPAFIGSPVTQLSPMANSSITHQSLESSTRLQVAELQKIMLTRFVRDTLWNGCKFFDSRTSADAEDAIMNICYKHVFHDARSQTIPKHTFWLCSRKLVTATLRNKRSSIVQRIRIAMKSKKGICLNILFCFSTCSCLYLSFALFFLHSVNRDD